VCRILIVSQSDSRGIAWLVGFHIDCSQKWFFLLPTKMTAVCGSRMVVPSVNSPWFLLASESEKFCSIPFEFNRWLEFLEIAIFHQGLRKRWHTAQSRLNLIWIKFGFWKHNIKLALLSKEAWLKMASIVRWTEHFQGSN